MQRPYHPRNSNRREPVVEDLRKKLNRIKQEKAHNVEVGTKNHPPPDPAYNFLKDPLRGDDCANSVAEKRVPNKDPRLKYEDKRESKANDTEQKNALKPTETSPHSNRNTNFKISPRVNRNTNFETSPRFNRNTNVENSPRLNQNTNFETSPRFNRNTNFETSPRCNRNTNGETSPRFNRNTDFETSPRFNRNTNIETSPRFNQNTNFETSPHLSRNFNFDKRSSRAPRGPQNYKDHTPQDTQQLRTWKDKAETQKFTKQQSVNNIKIILSSESGERKCTIDDTTLVEMPVARKNYAFKPKFGKGPQKDSQRHYSDENKQELPERNKGKTAEDDVKQLQTDFNENKSEAISPKETSEAVETVANNDSGISKETSQIIMNDNQTEQVNEEQAVETTKENNIQLTNNKSDSQIIMNNNKTEQVNEEQHVAEPTKENNLQLLTNNKSDSQIIMNNNKTQQVNEEQHVAEPTKENNLQLLTNNKSDSQIIMNNNKTVQVNEEQPAAELTKENNIQSANNSQAVQVQE